MSVVIGIDLGTSTITALALNAESRDLIATATVASKTETGAPGEATAGRCEVHARAILDAACACLRDVSRQLGAGWARLAGLGITGQQHGVVIVDGQQPRTPFINWQDRRGEETYPGGGTYVQEAARRAGDDAPRRTGCCLATGFMGVTLFWLRANGLLPAAGTACFLMDYFAAQLTGTPPVTDPTCAASSGLFDVQAGRWDGNLIAALDLPPGLFPEVRPSGAPLGTLTAAMARATGLPEGLPIFVGIGDNQASFLGSVADRDSSVLVNVGTGAQISVYVDEYRFDPLLELRPFPGGGYLLAWASLCGGRSYALLERFFRQVGEQVGRGTADQPLFATMNRLAEAVPPGADGLVCEPFFTGSRRQPELRGSWTGISAENFTPAHMTRALLEGLARAFRAGYDAIGRAGGSAKTQLVGSGNGLRENAVLRQCVVDEFGLSLRLPRHREEAAYGAAALAAVAAGLLPDLTTAGWLIRYS